MPNIGGKVFPSYTTRSESTMKGYMKSTKESRNKQRNRNMDEEDQEKKRSPLKSPRLCEENYSPNNLHLQIGIKRHYQPQKYDDLAQARPIENETYLHTLPQDEFDDSYEHKPRPPSGSPSLKKPRKRRMVTPQSSDKYEEYREKAEFGAEEMVSILSQDIKDIQASKRLVAEEQLQSLKIENASFKSALSKATNEIEDLLNKSKNLQKYKTDAEHKTNTLMNALKEKETEIEALSKELARAREMVSILSQDIKDIQASKRQVAEEKLQSLQTENASLKSALSKATNEKEHKLCNMQLSVKEKEINRLKGIVEKISMPLEAKMIRYEGEQPKKIDDLQRQIKRYKDELWSAKSNLKEEQGKTKQLIHQNQEKENELEEMRLKYMRLRKGIEEYKKIYERSAEREKKIVEQQTELERMCKKMGKFKQVNDALSEKNDDMEDRIRKLQSKLDHLERVEETHHLCVDIRDQQSRYIKELECEIEAQDKNFVLLQNEYDELDCRYSTMKAENAKVKNLQSELDAKTEEVNKLTRQHIRAESLSLEVKILQREKANVEEQNSELTRALQTKGIEMESLFKHRERSEKQIRNLNNEISDIQKSKRHTVNESLQQLLTENSALKSTLEHRKLEIENLSKECEKQRRTREKGEQEMTELEQVVQKKKNEEEELNRRLEEFSKKCSALHSDKEEAHAKISALTDALYEKKRDVESLTNQLERSETHVSVLNSRIDDLHTMNTEAVDKRYKDLSKELTNVKQDKENAESQISSLSNALYHKDKELESIQNILARAETQVSILSKDIKDIQESKRLADEKLQGLQTENSSLKSALSKATNDIDDFLKKDTNLHKYKTDAEHKTSTLNNALKEKETEIEALRKQLARAEENVLILSQDIKDMQASKRQVAEEKLQSLQIENSSLKSALSKATNEIEDLLNKGTNLQKYKTDAEHKTSTLMNALKEKETEIEALSKQLARAEEKVSILSQDIVDIQASKRLVAEEKIQSLQTENVSLKSALSKATNKIKDLMNKGTNLQKYKTDAEHKTSTLMNALKEKETEIEALSKQLERAEKNVSILSQDIKDIQASKRQVAGEKLQGLQTENASLKSALSKATNEIEDLLNKGTNLQKYKTDAEHKTSTLKNAMKEKESENEALREQLARAEKNVSILSQDIKDIQASKRQVAEEKLQGLQTENASLKSALSKATNEIEDLLNKGTNLQKYKTDAEHKTSTLMNVLKEKETEIKALSKQLARSEENVSILSKDIKNIKESKRQVADEKLQDLQTENASLKLTLAEATTEIDDLWNKCTNLQKYKSDTELEIRTLLNTIEEKETEIETLHKHLARSEKHVSNLLKDIKDIEGSKRQAADEKVQGLKTENASLKSAYAEATNEIDALRNKCTNLQKYKTDTEHTINTMFNAAKEKETESETVNRQLTRENNELSKDISNLKKDKENAENQRQSFSKALKEKEKEIEIMRNDIASMNDLSYKYKCLQKDKESAEYTINKLSNTVQEKEKEINSLIEDLAKANVDSEEYISSAYSIQKLKDENTSLKSELSQLSHETEKKVSALTKEIKSLQKSKGTSSEEYNARKLHDENEFLKAQLDRTSRSYEQLRKDYNEVKREKDHALNRLSSVAGEKLRNNNPGIADLSDENRPINLGEKFSQLYDDQWTDAIEHLEEMGYSETDGIRCLLDILKAVFDECVKLSDIHFNQLKELTGTSHLPSDQLKKLKDLRKATAIHSVAKTKHLVNDYMSKTFSKEKAACQTYIDRSIELCWLMSVQDPPVVIDFIAVHGQAIDDKILRKFTKTGSKIDFLVWPVIRLHRNGPLLQKGVVQPI